MRFIDRTDAGKKLGNLLKRYKENYVVYAIPRGGVIVGKEVSKILKAPLDLIITRKIPHPKYPEYAIGAVAEDGHLVSNQKELKEIDKKLFKRLVENSAIEAKRRRELYVTRKRKIKAQGKTAVLVDDGVATGLSIFLAVKELRHKKPLRIFVAVPVIPKSSEEKLRKDVNKIIAIENPSDEVFLGAVGAYYEEFPQVSDGQVIAALNS